MNFTGFTTESPIYKEALALRQRILRAPLGLDIYRENIEVEKNQLHYGLLDESILIACVSVVLQSPDHAKIRQMAVHENYRGQKLGTLLLDSCLKELKKKGYSEVFLNARKSAVPFYEKNSFHICSEEFIEVTVPHFKMARGI